VWSGTIMNGVMVNSGSRPALLASIVPPGLYFLSAPLFVLAAGEPILYGFVMIFASALNMVVVLKIWSMSRTLIDTERRERRMTYLTLHDPESGLPNRTALEQDIAVMLASDSSSILVVAALGIDRFTQLRGAIGYELFAGLIGEVANRLAEQHPGGLSCDYRQPNSALRFGQGIRNRPAPTPRHFNPASIHRCVWEKTGSTSASRSARLFTASDTNWSAP
jgi:predicted signal transduction protein with EAL and GGDEF domain